MVRTIGASGTVGITGLLGAIGAIGAIGLSGCGSKAPATGGGPTDADFAVCSGTPAVPYAPGMSVLSASGAYAVAIESAVTTTSSGMVSSPAIGFTTFTVSVTAVGDGGLDAGAVVDAGGVLPDGLTMTTPAVPTDVPYNPYMPVHMHGGSTVPAAAALGDGTFSVSDFDFIMGGYWQLYMNVVPSAGVSDRVTFLLCIPDD